MIARLLKLSAPCGVEGSLGLAAVHAKVPSACSTVRLGYGHWIDNKIENAVFKDLAQPLGYDVSNKPASLKAIYRHLANSRLDVTSPLNLPRNSVSSDRADR